MFLEFDEIIIDMLLYRLDEASKNYVRKCSKDDLILLHSSMGRFIRNEYKLWDTDNPLTMKDYVPLLQKQPDTHTVTINGKQVIISSKDVEVDVNPKHPDAVSMNIIQTIWRKLQ